MRNGIEHTLPVSASFNLFNYINISPQFNYTEVVFQEAGRQWNPLTNQVDYPRPAVRLLASVQLQRQRLGLDHPSTACTAPRTDTGSRSCRPCAIR